ncbi:hypothetical protein GX586_12795 [bacterium]|nr:hypothetical protein [bacterium]
MADNAQQEKKDQSGLIRLMGLWENTDRRGNKYLNGNLTASTRVMIFKNNFKQNEREPDYIVYLSQRSQEDRGGAPSQGGTQQSQAPAGTPSQPAREDDIPF